MLTTRFTAAIAATAMCMSFSIHAAVLTNPTLNSGANAIDPKNESVGITQIAAGVTASATESSLEAMTSFRTVQDFTGFNASGNNVISFTDADVPDIRFTEGEPFPFGAADDNAGIATSGTSFIRLGGQNSTLTFTIDFGSYDGTDFTVDRSSDAAAFVITDLRTNETATVRYYSDADDLATLLATQSYATPATENEAIYFGYRGDGTSTEAVQRIVIEISGVTGGRIRGFDDLGFTIVPEPASLALLGLGGLCMLRRRRHA